MRRSDALAEELISSGKCPVRSLVRLAERAEAEGDLNQAIGAWKSVLPYIHPKPKSVEFDPQLVVELARDIAAARAELSEPRVPDSHVKLLKQAMIALEISD